MRLRVNVYPHNATNKCVTWTSSDPNIATINPDSGIVLAQNEGNVTMFATAQDGSGVVGTYNLTVLPRIYADSMTISPNTATMYVKGQKGFCATIYPENTTSKTVRWHSEDHNIAEVDSVTGCVLAKALGTTKIYATAQDGSNVSAYATVHVVPRPVKDVMIQQDSVTLKKGETTQLSALVFPGVATNRSVTWESSDTDIATVSSGGLVTAISDGTATITVETDDGGFTDECIVTVDSREKVTITKDGNYFNITFSNGLVWKNVGRDLSLDENTSGNLGYGYLEWDNLYKWEQRFLDNFQNSYTEDQLAYIYYFDPLGVEDYMVNAQAPIYENKSMLESLEFKDSLYNKIFGIIPNKFYFNEDGEYSDYQNYQGWNRLNYYSNAEVLFGSHTIFNFDSLINHILKEVFTSFIPAYSYIELGVKLCQAMFFSGAIVGTGTNAAANLITDYLENELQSAVHSLLGWVGKYLNYLNTVSDIIDVSFDTMNSNDINIFVKTNENTHYRAVFNTPSLEVTITELIAKHNE